MSQLSLGKKVAIGAAWSILARFFVKSLGFISILILARILVPEDFGIIAATMIVVGLFEIIFNFSFDINIIQRKQVTNHTLNSAWTCKLIAGVSIALLLLIMSPSIASFFNDERLVSVICAIAGLPVLRSAMNIGFVLYRKELDLKSEFKLEAYAKIVSFLVTIGLAITLQSYWALLIGIYSNAITKFILSYTMHPYRPWFSLSEARELFAFSKWLLLRNVTFYFSTNAPSFMIGRLSSSTNLGYYSISFEVSNLPTTELLYPLSRAAYPGYVKLSDNPKELGRLFLKMSRMIVLLIAPISFGIAAVSEELVPALLGEQWLPVIPLLSLLAIYGFFRASSQNVEGVFIALGKPRLCFLIFAGLTIFYVPLLYFSYQDLGLNGIAYAMILNAIAYSTISYSFLKYQLQLSVLSLLNVYMFPLAASITMYLGVTAIGQFLSSVIHNIWLLLLIKVVLGVSIYGVIIISQHMFRPTNSLYDEAVGLIRHLKSH